jgi:DNA-binding SARP family transcriptional activator/DNA-binding MarR family transcriptional regulator
MLLQAPNRIVGVDQLAEAVWNGCPPNTFRTQIAICVAHLRKIFHSAGKSDEVIVTSAPGYMLVADDKQIDSVDFTTSVEAAQRLAGEGRVEDAARLFREALGLWRGRAFANISSPLLESEAALLEQQRLNALEQYATLEVELGRHREIVPQLTFLVQEQPLRESARATLMVAQYRSGNRSAALELFRQGRQAFIDALGLEPSRRLQELHEAILREDPALTPHAPVPLPTGASPAQLPADVTRLFGRERELAGLDRLLTVRCRGDAPMVGLVSGRPGLGKTALVVHWAHRAAADFPDGVLYAAIGEKDRGADDPSEITHEVLARFLRACGVADDEIPGSQAERAALFQRNMDGRRALVVLDDVGDPGQAWELVPRASTCCVIMTSGRAHPITAQARIRLTPLPVAAAVQLLDVMVGDHRVREQPPEAEEIVRLCDRLPRALAAAAARLTAKPHWPLSRLLARLRDSPQRLDELAHDDRGLRCALERGYRRLTPETADMYRRLGQAGVTESHPREVAELLGMSPATVEDLMEQLVDAGLLEVTDLGPDGQFRYSFPELLSLHGRERAAIEGAESIQVQGAVPG